ncbi:hypothetical protein FW778_01075 [Ginsengibacter hankyongi]|uniref:Uncharacterized protein n=1 Tax=Ginsengibacter hankyongi TaxID=2607284 RepID=A0A5J5IJT7_9BACT|nr:hypothetical protein [Ginsengibacter hankyongi]KAA9040663.1 hypothetical protein FW778_01075 [Ginsengibacter hankyongi]
MRKLIFTLLSSGFISLAIAQTPMSPNVLGEPFQGQHFKAKADNDVEGDPLVFGDWKKGEVTLKNGEHYPIQKMNLDGQRNRFLYQINDSIYEFQDNIREIKIYNGDDANSIIVFRNNVDPESDNFVALLDTGKITIFETYDKKPEGENYSNGIVNNTRKYVLHTTQYALINKVANPIKFNSSTLEDLTSDKKKEVEAFVKENKLKVKKEPDFLKAINYYNSIGS